jgi:hypothetical protein
LDKHASNALPRDHYVVVAGQQIKTPLAVADRLAAVLAVYFDQHVRHMHYRGAALEYKVFYPDGRAEVLLNVPNYSFSWQATYIPKQPIAIPKGTRFLVTGYFDNSAKNKFNPDPSQAVRFGQPTYDEMMIGFINYTVDSQHLKPVSASSSGER